MRDDWCGTKVGFLNVIGYQRAGGRLLLFGVMYILLSDVKLSYPYAPEAVPGGEEKKEEESQSISPPFPTGENAEPHIYEVSCLAYRGIAVDHTDQTILVTGESGSGKTETVKILLEHLATLEFLCPDKQMEVPGANLDVVKKVMESSVVLEALGNAQTRRNDNSSRFGKLMQLHFKTTADFDDVRAMPLCSLVGSSCTTYLLEKTRVASHGVGERSFHIFYQLLAAPTEFKMALWPFFASLKPTEFAYLAQFGECDLESEHDASQWNNTVNAFRTFDVQGGQLDTLMRALAIVLQLGNLRFGEAHTSDGERTTIVTTTAELSRLCEMIGIDEQDMEKALTSRGIKTNFEELRVPLQPSLAKESTDALAQEIYAITFAYIVRHLNDQMRPENDDDICGSIALVDIYGFERLAVNRFEQLCINYANEQLQQKYVADNFRVLKQEYDQEGIDIFDFSLVDNSDVLDLLDGLSGVFVALQEECVRPMASDEAFVAKVNKDNETHRRLIREKLYSKTEFGIRHFAGPVIYDATKFVERNIDRVSEDLLHCASKTKNSLIGCELQRALQKRGAKSKSGESTSGTRISGMTLIEKFSTELRDLLVAMDGTQTRYIRCIIPNEFMSPGVTNHLMTLRQLEYAGLMTSVALTRESLPDSLSYKALLRRFGCLLKYSDRLKMQEMELADQIVYLLTNLFVPTLKAQDGGTPSMPFACGKTKAYLRAGALEHLEAMRYRFFLICSMLIQSNFRRWREQKMYLGLRRSVVALQATTRRLLVKRWSRRRDAAARFIVWWLRGRLIDRANAKLATQEAAANKIQANWRAARIASSYKNLLRSIVIIQRSHRSRKPVNKQHESVLIPIEDMDSSSNYLLGALGEARKRLALRKAAIPRFRRADHSFLAEIDGYAILEY
jgi:myosin heavy subunit